MTGIELASDKNTTANHQFEVLSQSDAYRSGAGLRGPGGSQINVAARGNNLPSTVMEKESEHAVNMLTPKSKLNQRRAVMRGPSFADIVEGK